MVNGIISCPEITAEEIVLPVVLTGKEFVAKSLVVNEKIWRSADRYINFKSPYKIIDSKEVKINSKEKIFV